MPGEDKQTQEQTQQSKTEPWAPAQPLLQKLLNSYSGQSTAVTGGQSSALDNLASSAAAIPNFGGQGAEAVNKLFGTTTAPQIGMLSGALDTLKGNIGGTASGAELDPNSTPGFSDALATVGNDITNRVKGVYAGSGRDPSGAGSFAGSLGRGLAQGMAPIIQSQFNTNKGNQMTAASRLFDATGGTAGAITEQQQKPLTNAAAAIGLLPQLSQAFTMPGTTQLSAANAAYSQPFANLGMLLNPATQIAGLGGQTQGSSTTTATQPQNTMSNIFGGISSGIGLLSLLSDERAKEDIEEVGELHDGQPIYRYRYKGSPVPQIGLLAQEVLEAEPDAVEHVGGMLRVNYGRATERAAAMARAA